MIRKLSWVAQFSHDQAPHGQSGPRPRQESAGWLALLDPSGYEGADRNRRIMALGC